MSLIFNYLFQQFSQIHINPKSFIIGVCAFNQGIQHLSDLAINYMMKDTFGLSPAMMGIYLSYTTIPWLIKPFWGIITDSKPLFGYRRKSYIMLFGLLDSLGWILMSFLGIQSLWGTIALLFLIELSICFVNVIGEAILVEVAAQAQHDQTQPNFQHGASKNVSIFFGIRAVGALLSAYSSGALLEYISYSQIFLITSIFPLILVITCLFYNESKRTEEQIATNTTSQCLIDFWSFFKSPLIYQPVILIFCFGMTPSSASIMFYFYTEVLNFGPHFLGQLKFMYSIATILGVLIYNQFLKDTTFKKIFLSTTLLYYVCYQSVILLVTRKNIELGINDKLFCIGDQVMLQFVGELNAMPILVLACKMCPPNVEATMYSILMSTLNFSSMIGIWLGSLLLILLHIDQTDYSRLWLFIIIAGICMLLPLPWINIIQEDKIMAHRESKQQKQNKKEKVEDENDPFLE